MRAWEVRDGNLGLRQVEPAHTAYGETAVQITHTGICGSDLPKLARPGAFALPEPWRPGHEIVGIDPAGRTVAVDPLIPCGTCNRCVLGDIHLCPALRRVGWDLPGGFAEQVVIPVANTRSLPNGVDPLHAVLADPTAVAIHGVRCTPVAPPGRMAIIGAGTVGLLTALYADQQGWDVTVMHHDGRPPPPAIVDAIPATFHSPRTLESTSGFDMVVDAASGVDSAPLELALQLVCDGGAIIVQNAYHPDVFLPTPLRELFRRSIRLIGSFSHCRRDACDFDIALTLLDQCADAAALLVMQVGALVDLDTFVGRVPRHATRRALIVADI